MQCCQTNTNVCAMRPVWSSAIQHEVLEEINLVLNFNLQLAGEAFLQGNTSLPSTVGHNEQTRFPGTPMTGERLNPIKWKSPELPSSQQLIHNLLYEANDLERSLFRQLKEWISIGWTVQHSFSRLAGMTYIVYWLGHYYSLEAYISVQRQAIKQSLAKLFTFTVCY